MENTNEMELIFDSRSSNEAFARVTVAAFMTSAEPHGGGGVGCEDRRVGGGDQRHHPRV